MWHGDSVTIDYYYILAFPADIGRQPALPARACESRQRLNAGESRLCRWCETPANETVFSIFGRQNMAAPIRSVRFRRGKPKTINRSVFYIYNYYCKYWNIFIFHDFLSISLWTCFNWTGGEDKFEVDAVSGVVRTKGSQPFRLGKEYEIGVSAQDINAKTPQKSATHSLKILVGEREPQFYETQYIANVPETADEQYKWAIRHLKYLWLISITWCKVLQTILELNDNNYISEMKFNWWLKVWIIFRKTKSND